VIGPCSSAKLVRRGCAARYERSGTGATHSEARASMARTYPWPVQAPGGVRLLVGSGRWSSSVGALGPPAAHASHPLFAAGGAAAGGHRSRRPGRRRGSGRAADPGAGGAGGRPGAAGPGRRPGCPGPRPAKRLGGSGPGWPPPLRPAGAPPVRALRPPLAQWHFPSQPEPMSLERTRFCQGWRACCLRATRSVARAWP